MGIRYRPEYPPAYRPPYRPKKEGGAPEPRPITPSSGALCDLISARDALLKPIQHFLLDPTHPALTELYPFRECSSRLQAGNMLRGVENKLLKLTL